jgi:hypothetical protein
MADDPSKEHTYAEAQFKQTQRAQRAAEGKQAMSNAMPNTPRPRG